MYIKQSENLSANSRVRSLSAAEGLEVADIIYAHVKFDVRENKILALEKVSDIAEIKIPESDVEAN